MITGINLSLRHPDTKRLRVDPELVTDPGTRPRTAHRVLAGVQSHPDSSLSQLLPPVQENVMQMYLRSESSGGLFVAVTRVMLLTTN